MFSSVEFNAELVSTIEKDGPVLRGRALKLTKDPDTAEDLLSDTLERAIRKWDKYQPGTNMKAWLSQILFNTRLNQLRRPANEFEENAVPLNRSDNSLEVSPEVEKTRPHRSAEDEALENFRIQEVYEGISAVHPRHGRLIMLVDIRGFNYKEAARMTGVPVGSVASGLSRGRRDLAQRLAHLQDR